MKPFALASALIVALPLAAPARIQSTDGGGDGSALARGLAAIRPQNIKADLYFIASDEMQGRDTPSPGLRMAARYIRARLQRLGFTPAGDDGFFDLYQLSRRGIDKEATAAWVIDGAKEKKLTFGEDYYFWPGGPRQSDVQGDVVYVGDGSAEAIEGLDLEGCWALALAPQGGMRGGIPAVGDSGAKGLILGNARNREFARRIAQFVGRGSMQVVTGAEKEDRGAFPTVMLTEETTAEILAGGEPNVGEKLGITFHDKRAASPGEVMQLENVCGLWPGSDPELMHEVIIISAHYDHVGVNGDDIYNGADDNGSGTCGLMALAEALHAAGPLRRSVLLLWVSGEEKGLLGSQAWTEDPTLPEGYRPICDLNIDMIGRNAPDKLLITPTREHPAYNGLTRLAEEMAPLEGFPELGSCDEYWQRSDHMNFNDNLGIPVAFLFSDVHEDYHQPTDTPDKIDYDKIHRVARTVFRMLDALQTDTLSLQRQ